MSDDNKTTVDGVPVKLGDVVWIWRGWGNVKQRRLDKVDIGTWWAMRKTEIFSTERAALARAIADQRSELKRLTNKARSTRRTLELLGRRLEEVERQ